MSSFLGLLFILCCCLLARFLDLCFALLLRLVFVCVCLCLFVCCFCVVLLVRFFDVCVVLLFRLAFVCVCLCAYFVSVSGLQYIIHDGATCVARDAHGLSRDGYT